MGAAADGLFADQQLAVDVLEPGRGRGPDNIIRVAEGGSDFCLTSVHHYLSAREQAGGDLAARFAAIVVRHSPLAAIVRLDSPITAASDLAGRRVTGSPDKPHTAEFLATLRELGLGVPESVALDPEEARGALADGDVDALVEFVDALPRLQRLAGTALRAVPVGLPIYASGLVAADRLPDELVARMRAALVAALQAQRDDPERGLDALVQRFPEIRPDEARAGWRLMEPYVFSGGEPGAMDEATWHTTLTLLCAARGLEVPEPAKVYRQVPPSPAASDRSPDSLSTQLG